MAITDEITRVIRERIQGFDGAATDATMTSVGTVLTVADGTRVLVAGAVTHRQRPATAQGVTFINLEDETGMVNVLCSPGVWARHRKLAQAAPALLVRGQVQNATGAVTVIADRLGKLELRVGSRSRDFR